MNKSLDRLKRILDKEIDKVTDKGEIAPAEIKPLGDIVDIYKDIETICAMEEYGDDDESYSMSNRGYSSRRMSRYAYDEMPDYYGRSRDNYSRHSEKEEMIEKLERKLRNAKTEEERRYITECIDTLDR